MSRYPRNHVAGDDHPEREMPQEWPGEDYRFGHHPRVDRTTAGGSRGRERETRDDDTWYALRDVDRPGPRSVAHDRHPASAPGPQGRGEHRLRGHDDEWSGSAGSGTRGDPGMYGEYASEREAAGIGGDVFRASEAAGAASRGRWSSMRGEEDYSDGPRFGTGRVRSDQRYPGYGGYGGYPDSDEPDTGGGSAPVSSWGAGPWYGAGHGGQVPPEAMGIGETARQRHATESTHRGAGSAPRSGFRGHGPKSYRRSDQRLHEDVCERLSDDPDVDARGIGVQVSEGVVTLEGEVTERWLKHHAENIVDRCNGVIGIENRIRVARPRENRDPLAEGQRVS